MRKTLFRDAEAIIEGYGLKAQRGERKVYLLGRALKSGNVALIRYACSGGIRKRVSIGVMLRPETSLIVKQENEELLRLQGVECDLLNADLQRSETSFAPLVKGKVRLVDYVEKLKEDALAETGNKHSYYATLNSLAKHVAAYDEAATMKHVTKEWLEGFVGYLRHDAVNLNYQRAEQDSDRKRVGLSQNSQCRLMRNMNYTLNHAVKENLLPTNPLAALDKSDRISPKTGTRHYLTKEEVHTLLATPYEWPTKDIKRAFLFACMTGLRYSDLQHISHQDFHTDKVGTYLAITMVKTKEPLKVYVPAAAMDLVGEGSGDGPVFNLPKNEHANKYLRRWVAAAGVGKEVTFHVARHTAATLLLSSGLPIAVVSKQLGHLKIATTEIYAKIVDDEQAKAAEMMDSIVSI